MERDYSRKDFFLKIKKKYSQNQREKLYSTMYLSKKIFFKANTLLCVKFEKNYYIIGTSLFIGASSVRILLFLEFLVLNRYFRNWHLRKIWVYVGMPVKNIQNKVFG